MLMSIKTTMFQKIRNNTVCLILYLIFIYTNMKLKIKKIKLPFLKKKFKSTKKKAKIKK